MAKQRGIIQVKGTIGGLTFYERNGQGLLRTPGGVSKERIQNDPNFVRVRENLKEFSGAAKAGKGLRVGLAPVIETMADSNIASRLLKYFRTMINRAPGVRGNRPVQVVANKEVLAGFELDEAIQFSSIFHAPYNMTANADRNAIQVDVPAFAAQIYITSPSPATHFRLIVGSLALSEYVYNSDTDKYESTDPDNNTLHDFEASDYFPVKGDIPADLSLNAALPGSPAILATTGLIGCLGVEFYQEVSGAKYLLATSNAMQLVNVF